MQALALTGKAMTADRAYVFMSRDMVFLDNTHEWCAEGVVSMRRQLQKVPYSDADPFWKTFRRMGIMVIPDLEQIAPDSGLRQILDGQGIRALIAAAIWIDGQIAGFVGFDFLNGPRAFRPDEDIAVRNFAATIALALHARELSRKLVRAKAERDIADVRLSAAISRAPRLLVETDRLGIITGFFQSAPMVFALNPQEVIGAPPEAVLPPHVATIVRKAIQEVDTLGWSQSHTYSLDVGGAQKWYSLSAMARGTSQSPRSNGYMFVVSDISETHRQDAQIRQLVRVAELSTNLILLLDKDRCITWANPAFHARTGYPNAMVIGKLPSEVLHLTDDQPNRVTEVCEVLKSGHSINQEFSARSRRGVQFWLDLNIQPLRSLEGEVQGFMLVGVDITTHKMAEARALRDKVRTLDASKEGYAIFWPDGRVAFINAELRKLLHLPDTVQVDDLIWTDLALPDFTERMVRIMPELMAQGYWSGEFKLPDPDGDVRHMELSLTVQDDGSLFLVVRDVTRRRRAEAEHARLSMQLQVAQSRQVMSHMAAGMAHDFANLLAVISGSVEVLDTHSASASDAASLARIRQASEQGRKLVEGLLKLGTDTPSRARIDLRDVINRTINLIRPSLNAPVLVQTETVDPIWMIADQSQVMQVAINLLLNADQAMASRPGQKRNEGDQISVSVSTQTIPAEIPNSQVGRLLAGQTYAVLTIADTGPGIPDARKAEIFAPFVRSCVTAETSKNAGLGLAIVAHVVSLHGGAVCVSNQNGSGAEVRVFWPMSAELHILPPTYAPECTDLNQPLKGLNVLLVDDDDHVLQTLSSILTKAGAETASCDNPLDALAAVIEDPDAWDAVVTDHDMTQMTGLELADELLKTVPDMKIVLVSGASQLHFATDAVHVVPVSMLRKPISGPELIAVLLREKLRDAGGPTKG